MIGILINNYLARAGKGQKYILQIEIAESSTEMLQSLFRSCPSFLNMENSSSFWLPLDGKLFKLGRRQEEVYSIEEISAAKGVLEFPDILDSRDTSQELMKGKALPNITADSLPRFGTVITKFTLKSWTIGTGGITASLLEVILIDNNMRPKNLQQSLDNNVLSSPSKRTKVII